MAKFSKPLHKDFGAVGDGSDHPLSEKFSTLSAAQMVYPFVTALTQTQDYAGIQSAINAAKLLNAGVVIPSGKYIVNSGLLADYALSMHGEGSGGLRDIASSGHSPSPVRGSVIMSKVSSGRTLSIVGTPSYSFGMTLRDFAIWGVEGQCDVGLYTHNVGWTGIISGVNIQRFPNQAWEIGYIQDVYVNNCTFLYSGSKDKPAVHCPNLDSNYIYFNGCHFECSPYLIGFDDVWFVSFTQCHFEIARPINGSSDDRYVYQTAPINLGATTRQVQFSNNTFIPTDVGFLSSKLGVARDQVPYFIAGNGNSISFNGDIFMAPEGSVNAAYLSGSGISVQGVKFIRMSPSKEFLHIGGGQVSNCTFGIDAAEDTTKLYGVYVGSGSVIGNEFGFYGADSGGKRPEGGLLFGGAFASGNHYPDDDRVFIYLDTTMKVDGIDGGDERYVTITSSSTIDLTKVHPSTHYEINGNSVAITNIYGAPLGRGLIVRVSGGTSSGVKYVAGEVETQGATDWSPGTSHATLFKCIKSTAGKVMYQVSQ
ncbi:head-binding protein [Citrobacter freundii]|nr:head-binding protein [Citrobacter freundii]